APATDIVGNPPYDDTGVAVTGAGTIPYYAMGAYQRTDASTPDANLVLTLNSAPTSVVAGDFVTLTWTVTNTGPHTAVAPWTDSVELILDDSSALPPTDLLDVSHTTDLGVGQSYQVQASVPVGDAAPGTYQWMVIADSHQQIFEGADRSASQAMS